MKERIPPLLKSQLQKREETLAKYERHNLPKDFCIVPFTNLILEPGGDVGVCRQKGTEFIIGNIRETPLDKIWNNEFIKKWRREFLEGKPQVCSREVAHQRCNLCPHNNDLLDFVEFKEEQSQSFLKLTANLNGLCNLQCQMCHVWKMPNGFYNEENFWRPGRENFFHHLKEVDLLSGEPFLQADTFKLVDEISSVNPDCQWMFTTNAHWKFSEKIEASLEKIKIKYILLSVDSLNPKTYHKIRYPGNLEVVLQNIQELKKYNEQRRNKNLGPIEFRLNFLTQPDNWMEIPSVIDYCLKNNIVPFVTFLYEPHQYSLLSLPEKARELILEKLFKTLTPVELNLSHRVVIPLIQSLTTKSLKAYYLLNFHENNTDLLNSDL